MFIPYIQLISWNVLLIHSARRCELGAHYDTRSQYTIRYIPRVGVSWEECRELERAPEWGYIPRVGVSWELTKNPKRYEDLDTFRA